MLHHENIVTHCKFWLRGEFNMQRKLLIYSSFDITKMLKLYQKKIYNFFVIL